MTKETRLIDLTLDDLEKAIKGILEKSQERKGMDEYVYGMQGLADALGCSKSYANYLKRTGKYDKAIKQVGRLLIINKTKLMDLIPYIR